MTVQDESIRTGARLEMSQSAQIHRRVIIPFSSAYYLPFAFFFRNQCCGSRPGPNVFGPPDPGSGSLFHQAKILRKPLIPTV
jgi:hypothetical protein